MSPWRPCFRIIHFQSCCSFPSRFLIKKAFNIFANSNALVTYVDLAVIGQVHHRVMIYVYIVVL